jgi:CheY-like chemotaxis protein
MPKTSTLEASLPPAGTVRSASLGYRLLSARITGVRNVLVVDDLADNRRILVHQLRHLGEFVVSEATNGREAVDLVEASRPDLIFMDIKMPVMDGWEATKLIRNLEGGDAGRSRVSSGFSGDGVTNVYLQSGADPCRAPF